MLPVSALSDHLGFWLRAVSNHVSNSFANRLTEKETTVAEWVLLRALYDREASPPSKLADELGLTRGAVTKLADRLIAKGLVARAANTADRRAQFLSLTVEGQSLVPELAAIADQNDAECFKTLSEGDQTVLKDILMRLVEKGRITATPID